MRIRRESHFSTESIVKAIRAHGGVSDCDYVTLIADGEPTLDLRLGDNISEISSLGAKVAVITNASLLWDEGVRKELSKADWVSVKVDAVKEDVWRRVDRPHGKLRLDGILEGIREFASIYDGHLCSETMLVSGTNDDPSSIAAVAEFLAGTEVDKSYISVPLRPPAEPWVMVPDESAIAMAHSIIGDAGVDVELLTAPEEGTFGAPGSLEMELADIMSVHPMRIEQVLSLIEERGEDPTLIGRLVSEGVLREVEHRGTRYLMTVIRRSSP